MKNLLMLFVLAALVPWPAGCDQTDSSKAPGPSASDKDTDAPLLLEDEPLLLADDPAAKKAHHKGADNSRCFVCHVNYVREELAVTHARADIGCAKCHGASDAHIADESWASGGNGTPPEIMYPRAKINPFCLGCHKPEDIGVKRHKDVLAGAGKKNARTCTDCHGKHRLEKRKCKWK